MSDAYADLRALAENYLSIPGPADSQLRRWWYSAANPARILALLADLDEARAEVERLTGSLAQSKHATEKARERLSRLRSDGA